jgi:hypothetical protein
VRTASHPPFLIIENKVKFKLQSGSFLKFGKFENQNSNERNKLDTPESILDVSSPPQALWLWEGASPDPLTEVTRARLRGGQTPMEAAAAMGL